MKSVAIVSPSFYPMIGGVEGYVLGVGSELVKLGFEADVYTPEKVFGRHCGVPEETIQGINVHRIKVPLEFSYRIKVWPGLVDALQSKRHDLIHVYSHDSYAAFALMAARRMNTPLVLTTYGPFETHSDYGPLRAGVFRIYDTVVTPRLMGRSSAVFVRYPALEAWVESFGLPPEHIHLEPSGIPKNSLILRRSERLRENMGGGPIILYLGRISPQKGVQYAVDSMVKISKRFPSSRMVFIGPDYTGYSSKLRERSTELGVSDNVAFLGPMEDEVEQLEAISACDVFVMPSSFEGFSQAVMKAMAQEKPVVVTNVGGLPYEVDYGKCGRICSYGDSNELAQNVIEVLGEPDSAAEMARSARARAESFTFDRLASRLATEYSKIAG